MQRGIIPPYSATTVYNNSQYNNRPLNVSINQRALPAFQYRGFIPDLLPRTLSTLHALQNQRIIFEDVNQRQLNAPPLKRVQRPYLSTSGTPMSVTLSQPQFPQPSSSEVLQIEQQEVPVPARKRDQVFSNLFAEGSMDGFKKEYIEHTVNITRGIAEKFARKALSQGKKVDVKQYWKSVKHRIANAYREVIDKNQNSLSDYPVRVVSETHSLLDEKTRERSENRYKKSLMSSAKSAIFEEFNRLNAAVAPTTDRKSSRKRKTRNEIGGRTVRLQKGKKDKRPRLSNNEPEKNMGPNSQQAAAGAAPNLQNRMAAHFRLDFGQIENSVDKFSKDLQKKEIPCGKA